MESIAVVVAFMSQEPMLAAVLVIILEIPRYSFSLLATLAAGFTRDSDPIECDANALITPQVTAIVPAFNGGDGLTRTLDSLLHPSQGITRVIVVDDGSTDDTPQVLARHVARDPRITPLTHPLRTGKSAAINHAASLSETPLLLTIDVDTTLQPGAARRLALAFEDPEVGVASGNVLVANARRNLLTALQSVEYLLSVSMGRGFLDHLGAVGCCSGAFTMIRRSEFAAIGGFNVGPGEDLDLTLRLRARGQRTRFVSEAVAETAVPYRLSRLVRQRLRWDRDAMGIRVLTFGQLSLPRRDEPLSDLMERMDFVIFDLMATLVFPIYLLAVAFRFGDDFGPLMVGTFVALLAITGVNLAVAYLAARRVPTSLALLALAVFPLYQGFILRFLRFFAFTDELIFAGSRRDDFVPDRIRAALANRSSE